MEILRLSGNQARKYVKELAHLRLQVFYEFPYLYEGTLDYEIKYLETYFKAEHSIIILLKDVDSIIGASTGIWAKEEEAAFKVPLIEWGLNPDQVFYFGESVILAEYRGRGFGKMFFQERESFARSLPNIKNIAFCRVVREVNHPLKPIEYRPLDTFWQSQGFQEAAGLATLYSWKDRTEKQETVKQMQYWIKEMT